MTAELKAAQIPSEQPITEPRPFFPLSDARFNDDAIVLTSRDNRLDTMARSVNCLECRAELKERSDGRLIPHHFFIFDLWRD